MYLLLYVLWVIFNGKLTLEIALVGIAVVAAVGALSYGLFRYTPKREWKLLRRLGLFLAYTVVLLWEIIKANFAVMYFIVSEKPAIDPELVTLTVELKTEFARFMLANSITLTPGTITVAVEGDQFVVHCLCPAMLEGIESGAFVQLLRKMEA